MGPEVSDEADPGSNTRPHVGPLWVDAEVAVEVTQALNIRLTYYTS